MKKYISALLLSSVLTIGLSATVSAEISPYVSAKYAYTHIRNDAHSGVDFTYGSVGVKNDIVNKELSDNKSGLRFAVGVTVPVDAIWGDIRGEIEYAHNFNAKNEGDSTFNWYPGGGTGADITFKNTLRSNVVFLNVYYDIETCTDFIPYIGGGIGYARLRNTAYLVNDNQGGTDKEENLAWNVGLGLGYSVTENITLDLGYRYTDYGRIKNNAVQEIPGGTMHSHAKYDVTSHEVSLGLRYNF